jgi:hypothetical protein
VTGVDGKEEIFSAASSSSDEVSSSSDEVSSSSSSSSSEDYSCQVKFLIHNEMWCHTIHV